MVSQEEYQRQMQEYQIQVALQRAMSAGRTAEGRLIPGATFSGREAHEQLMALGITDISQRKALIRKFTYGVYGTREMPIEPTAPTPYAKYTPTEQAKITAWSEKYKMSPTPETIQKEILAKPFTPEFLKPPISPFAPQGLTIAEQEKVRAWSEEYKMSPTPETIRKIIAKPYREPTPRELGYFQQMLPYQERGTRIPEPEPALIKYTGEPKTFGQFIIPEKAERFVSERTFGVLEKRYKITPEVIGEVGARVSPLGVGLGFGVGPKHVITHPKILKVQKEYISGIVEKPWKEPLGTTATFVAFAAMPVAFKGISAGAKALGISKGFLTLGKTYPITSKILKPGVKYGLAGAYGVSVGYRVAKAEVPARELGRITTGEALPMVFGYKAGAYGLRRYETFAEIKTVKAKLPPEKRLLLEQQLKEAKAFRKVQPKVREISFKGMERIPKKARPIISEFLKIKKGEIVVGGTFGTRTQLLTKELKPPHDIDIFFQGGKARTYTKELGRQLKDIKGFRTGAKAIYYRGAKAIEFHPVETHLRFNIEQFMPWYRTWRAGITKTPSGIRVLKMGVQYPMKTLGYYRYGPERFKDILYARKVARPTIMKQAQFETVGKKVFDVSHIPLQAVTPKGFTVLGSTDVVRGKAINIKLLKGLPPKVRREVLVHELIHAEHPFWPEAKVKGIIGPPEFIRAGIKLKAKPSPPVRVKVFKYPTYPKAPAPYPFIPKTPSLYPTRKPPTRIIYKPVIPRKEISFYPSFPRRPAPPYKPPTKAPPYYPPAKPPYPPPYKPPGLPPPPFITIKGPPRKPPRKPPWILGFPDVGTVKIPRRYRKIVQPQAYTPSLVASILRITAKKKPYVIPKKFYYGFLPGIRPLIR